MRAQMQHFLEEVKETWELLAQQQRNIEDLVIIICTTEGMTYEETQEQLLILKGKSNEQNM